MREIKFRGKRESTGEWFFGDFITDTREFNRTCDKAYILPYWDKLNAPIQVIKETVSQFIGSKDTNGLEIYEGDITELDVDGEVRRYEVAIETVVRKVKSHPTFADEYAEVEITGVVFKWNGFELFPCTKYRGLSDLQRMKVIGNIYDNPELLEVTT